MIPYYRKIKKSKSSKTYNLSPYIRYETSNPHLRFTEEQLADIRRVTMASLICENCDVVEQIQRGVFDMPHDFL